MCCDMCPRYYEECTEKDNLKGECCSKCPEYGYCTNQDEHDEDNLHHDDESQDSGKRRRIQ